MTRGEYVSFGGSDVGRALDISGTAKYLADQGFGGGYLERARAAIMADRDRSFTFEPLNSNYCDFCFVKLMGGEYDRLADGRERCLRCTRTVVRSTDDFEALFYDVRRNMESAFDVMLNVPVRVRMVNAREIARKTNETFEPTAGVDARVLGFATQGGDGYSLYIENGSPRLAAVGTLAHELTHIWQYRNWNAKQIEQRYGARHRLVIYEGMAAWAQVQYLLYMNETEDAARQEAYLHQRTDEYGVGFRMYLERYDLSRDGDVDRDTPFRHPFPL